MRNSGVISSSEMSYIKRSNSFTVCPNSTEYLFIVGSLSMFCIGFIPYVYEIKCSDEYNEISLFSGSLVSKIGDKLVGNKSIVSYWVKWGEG